MVIGVDDQAVVQAHRRKVEAGAGQRALQRAQVIAGRGQQAQLRRDELLIETILRRVAAIKRQLHLRRMASVNGIVESVPGNEDKTAREHIDRVQKVLRRAKADRAAPGLLLLCLRRRDDDEGQGDGGDE